MAGALSAHGLPTTYKSPRREKASATPAVAFDTDVDAERAKGRPPKGFAKLNGAEFGPLDSYCDPDFEDLHDKERIAITYAYDGKFWDHQLIVLQVVTEGPDAESSKCYTAELDAKGGPPKQDDPEVWKRDWKRLLREHPFTVYTEMHEVKCEGAPAEDDGHGQVVLASEKNYLPKLGSVMARTITLKRGNVCKAFHAANTKWLRKGPYKAYGISPNNCQTWAQTFTKELKKRGRWALRSPKRERW